MKSSIHGWRKEALWCVAVLLFWMYLLMPWQPLVGTGLDYAWTLYLHEAYAQGLMFGSEFVFNYGPLGFVQQPVYHPETRGVTFVLSGLVCALAVLGLWVGGGRWLARRPEARAAGLCLIGVFGAVVDPWYALGLVVGVAALFTPRLGRFRLVLLAREGIKVSRALAHRRVLTAGWILLAVAMAVFAQMKLTLGISMAMVIGAMFIRAQGRRRVLGPFRFACVFAVSWLAIWVWAGQSLWGLVEYFALSVRIVAGYGEAMAFPGPLGSVIVFIAGIGIVLWGALRSLGNNWLCVRRDWGAMLGLGGVMFLLYKATITRNDMGHLSLGAHALCCVGLVLGMSLVFGRVRERKKRVAGLWMLAGLLAVFGFETGSVAQPFIRAGSLDHAQSVVDWVTGGNKKYVEGWEKGKELGREFLGTGAPGVTADIYPTQMDLLIQAGYTPSVRPTAQSYITQGDPVLLEMNANHLLGSRAPQLIFLMRDLPVDQQYPTFNDSLSWPILLTHYDVVGAQGEVVILRKSAAARRYRLDPMGSRKGKLGERIEVPGTPPGAAGIWVSVSIKPSLWGKVRGLFYVHPILTMDTELGSGETVRSRFVPSFGESSFLLSPRIEFGKRWPMFAGAPTNEVFDAVKVKWLTMTGFDSDVVKGSYEDDVELTWYAFYFEAQPGLVRSEPVK